MPPIFLKENKRGRDKAWVRQIKHLSFVRNARISLKPGTNFAPSALSTTKYLLFARQWSDSTLVDIETALSIW